MKVELDSWQDTQTWTLVLSWLTEQISTATPQNLVSFFKWLEVGWNICFHSALISFELLTGGWDLIWGHSFLPQSGVLVCTDTHVLKSNHLFLELVSSGFWRFRSGSLLLQCSHAVTRPFLFHSWVQMSRILLPDCCLLLTLETHQESVLFVTL